MAIRRKEFLAMFRTMFSIYFRTKLLTITPAYLTWDPVSHIEHNQIQCGSIAFLKEQKPQIISEMIFHSISHFGYV